MKQVAMTHAMNLTVLLLLLSGVGSLHMSSTLKGFGASVIELGQRGVSAARNSGIGVSVADLSQRGVSAARNSLLPDQSQRANFKVSDDTSSLTKTQMQRELLPYAGALFLASSASALFESLQPLQVMAEAEAVFYAYCQFLLQFSLKHPVRVGTWQHDRTWPETWAMVLKSVENPREWFASWFVDWPQSLRFEDITAEDAREFLSWAMFASVWEELAIPERGVVKAAVRQIEEGTKWTFRKRQQGAAPHKSMRSTIEPLRFWHKPLVFYAFTQGLFGLHLQREMKKMGFTSHTKGGFRYFSFRRSENRAEAGAAGAGAGPIVFWHGVGGLAAYLPLAKGLISMGRDVVCVEMPYVSLHVSPRVPSIDDHVELFEDIMGSLGYAPGRGKAVLVGHSWGTNVVTWLVKALGKERVETAVFLDPVCLMLHLKDITANWVYAKTAADATQAPLVSVSSLVSLVKTELFVVNTLQRHLVWFRNLLLASDLQDLGVHSMVVVSENDHIVPSDEVLAHVEGHNQECASRGVESVISATKLRGVDHGGLVFDERYRTEVLGIIAGAVTRGAELAAAREKASEAAPTRPIVSSPKATVGTSV